MMSFRGKVNSLMLSRKKVHMTEESCKGTNKDRNGKVLNNTAIFIMYLRNRFSPCCFDFLAFLVGVLGSSSS